jgi:hypothetical protein
MLNFRKILYQKRPKRKRSRETETEAKRHSGEKKGIDRRTYRAGMGEG